MLPTYQSWIADYLVRHNGAVLGRCRSATEEMRAVFPELEIVRGHVWCPAPWGKRGHAWLRTAEGEIVDPTVSQFPAVLAYEPWEPGSEVLVGKCMECGSEIWAAVDTLDGPPPHKTFCDDTCERSCIRAVESGVF